MFWLLIADLCCGCVFVVTGYVSSLGLLLANICFCGCVLVIVLGFLVVFAGGL